MIGLLNTSPNTYIPSTVRYRAGKFATSKSVWRCGGGVCNCLWFQGFTSTEVNHVKEMGFFVFVFAFLQPLSACLKMEHVSISFPTCWFCSDKRTKDLTWQDPLISWDWSSAFSTKDRRTSNTLSSILKYTLEKTTMTSEIHPFLF